jgi:hypothetical protein
MVSGGERKRVNIGSELLTDPAIILLDEPTSGLDSTSAVALMRILESLAREEGKTIITSIHQPSSAVFFGFDKLMLLADGNVVYFGTPKDSLEHVKKLGLECPAGYNAADHHMDLLVVDSAIDEDDEQDTTFIDNGTEQNNGEAPGLASRLRGGNGTRQSIGGTTTKQKLINSWDPEAAAIQVEEEVKSQFGSSGRRLNRQQSVIMTEKSFNTTWWTQYTVLVHRSMKNSRSAIFTRLNLIKAGAIGLMCGLLWFQMPYTESTIFDRSSYYFFTMTFWVRVKTVTCCCAMMYSCTNLSCFNCCSLRFSTPCSLRIWHSLWKGVLFSRKGALEHIGCRRILWRSKCLLSKILHHLPILNLTRTFLIYCYL